MLVREKVPAQQSSTSRFALLLSYTFPSRVSVGGRFFVMWHNYFSHESCAFRTIPAQSIPFLAWLAFVGCSGEPNESPRPAEASSTSQKTRQIDSTLADIKQVSTASLPNLEEYLPVSLDQGRVRIAPPLQWYRGSRSSKYLARFHLYQKQEIPRIVVYGESFESTQWITLSEANIKAFGQFVAQRLEESNKRVVESVRPMLIGSHAFARYVLLQRATHKNVEVQVLETVVNSRRYRVELTAYEKTIEDEHPLVLHRDQAYAVAAGLDFQLSSDELNSKTPNPDKPLNPHAEQDH